MLIIVSRMTSSYCKVAYCRYNNTHVTKGHKCGNCGQYAHGDAECRYPYLIENLAKYHNETLPEYKHCTVEDCVAKMLHTVDAHHCPICNKRDAHTIANCPSQSSEPPKIYHAKCPVCREENTLVNPRKVYGLNDECCICCDNKVEVLFPKCYHCCICFECLDKKML